MVDARSIPFSQISVSPRTPDAPKRFHYRFDRVALDAFMITNTVAVPSIGPFAKGL